MNKYILFITAALTITLNAFGRTDAGTVLADKANEAITLSFEIQDLHRSTISPNPAKTFTTLRFQNPNDIEHRVELYDVIGNRVRTYYDIETDKLELDVRDLNPGVYFYFIIKDSSEKVSTGRLIVRR